MSTTEKKRAREDGKSSGKNKKQKEIRVEGVAVSVNEDDLFFSKKLDMIPADVYMPKQDMEDYTPTVYTRNKKELAPKQNVKEATKKAQKRREKFEQAAEETPSTVDQIAENIKHNDETIRKEMSAEDGEQAVNRAPTPAKNIEELKERLARKLQTFQTPSKEIKVDKKAKREEEKERKRSQKRESKRAKKLALKQLGEKENEENEEEEESPEDHETMLRNKVTESILSAKKNPKESVSFGLITENDEKEDEEGNRYKEKKGGPGKRSLLSVKQMLKNAEENKALIEELKKSTDPEDRKLAEMKEWEKMEKKALGEKILEPKQLKNEVKRLERKKRKSTREWASRVKSESDAKQERLDKREANIENAQRKRVATKLKKKGIVLDNDEEKGSGRKRAGFEGRHKGFLNGSSEDSKKMDSGKGDKKRRE